MVRFVNPFSLGNATGNGVLGVTYAWRFLPTNGSEETSGSAKLFAKLSDGHAEDRWSTLQCGSIQLQWSPIDSGLGAITYDAKHMNVHPVSDSYFQNNPLKLSDFAASEQQPKVRLAENGAQPQRNQSRSRVAGLVQYENSTAITHDANGVAVFEFIESFDRQTPENDVQRGVSYRYTFYPRQGKVLNGQGEVFELYRNDNYNGDGSQLDLEAGPTRVRWSYGGKSSGWLYYDPTSFRVWDGATSQLDRLLYLIKDYPDRLFNPTLEDRATE
ncbi:MAG: hypothetical protein KDB03_08985 [Planctomycetales bacterium]|nr:hypothetical protein [Planctomycetales bacterium]